MELELLKIVGLECKNITDLEGLIIEREELLMEEKYEEAKKYIKELKKSYSSSYMTSLQDKAESRQKWPLLNLMRQMLLVHNMDMVPIRKSYGYTKEGKKRYKRYFRIEKI